VPYNATPASLKTFLETKGVTVVKVKKIMKGRKCFAFATIKNSHLLVLLGRASFMGREIYFKRSNKAKNYKPIAIADAGRNKKSLVFSVTSFYIGSMTKSGSYSPDFELWSGEIQNKSNSILQFLKSNISYKNKTMKITCEIGYAQAYLVEFYEVSRYAFNILLHVKHPPKFIGEKEANSDQLEKKLDLEQPISRKSSARF